LVINSEEKKSKWQLNYTGASHLPSSGEIGFICLLLTHSEWVCGIYLDDT